MASLLAGLLSALTAPCAHAGETVPPDQNTPAELLAPQSFGTPPSSILQPPDLTPGALAASLNAIAHAPLKLDNDCGFDSSTIQDTEHVATTANDKKTCNGFDHELVYRKSTKSLYLCNAGKITSAVRLSIGRDGIGKTAEGDDKTPLGTYWLGFPRASSDFGIFIPVGYPNADDIKAGYTGGDIGIHAPARFWACMTFFTLGNDWTSGCVAVSRDQQIKDIAHWVLDNWPVKIHFLDL